jgi:hypothetical protein
VARYEGGVVQVMGNGARANTETYYAAAGTSPSDIWVGGDNGVVSHFDGTSWSTSRALKGTLSSLATVVPGEVWATQRNFDDGSDTAIYRLLHLSNNIWAAEGPLVPVLNSVWIAPSGQVLAVGRRGTVLQAAPGAQPVLVPSFTTSELTGITGTSDSDVWVCGDHVLFHFDGTSWAPVAVTQDDWRSLVANGNDLYLSSPNRIFKLHLDGTLDGTVVDLPGTPFESRLAVAADGTLLTGNSNGAALKGVWPNVSGQDTGTNRQLRAAWLSADGSVGVLAGGGGTLLVWRRP